MILELFLISSASNPPPNINAFPTGGSVQGIYTFLIFLAVIATLRIYRGINGRAYSTYRVMRVPVVYVLLTLITVLAVGTFYPILVATLVLIPAGFLLGYRFGTKVRFFNRNNRLYYARSPVILILWLVSFIGRLIIELIIPQTLTVDFIIDVALCATTGVLIGEALNIVRKRREFVEPQDNQPSQDDSFRMNM